MRLMSWDGILDRLGLFLAGGAVLALALQGGAQLGQRGWSSAEAAALAVQAAVPDAAARADPLSPGCRTSGNPARTARNGNRLPPRP